MKTIIIKMINERFIYAKNKIKSYVHIFRTIDENNYEIYFDKQGTYETEDTIFYVFDPVEIKVEKTEKGFKLYNDVPFSLASVIGYIRNEEVFRSYNLTGKKEYNITCGKVSEIHLNCKNNTFCKEVI